MEGPHPDTRTVGLPLRQVATVLRFDPAAHPTGLLSLEAAAKRHSGKREDETAENKQISVGPADADLVGVCAAKVPGVVEVGSSVCFRDRNRKSG